MSKPLIPNFNNRFIKVLPFAFQSVNTTPFSHSFLVAHSQSAAKLISLPNDYIEHPDFIKIFSGELLPEGGHYTAQVYAGHQFGHFVPQLGDGRSISIGEIHNDQHEHYDVQLKGSGQTPYSRMGDGRAVLRSSIREFLASEAMAALRIPTTRALCITTTNDYVYRERAENGAIVTRLTQSNIRFGHFEYYFHHQKFTELDQLADFCIKHYFSDTSDNIEKPHLTMLRKIIELTATLIAKWQTVGFAHGVMNTDNMSILGLTIDYGPFGFLDDYNPNYICNHSDHAGRYAFEQQPSIGLWNLNALAYTFSRWLDADEIREALALYEPCLVEHYQNLMSKKLGFSQWQEQDNQILGPLMTIMAETKTDYTLAMRLLNQIKTDDHKNEHCREFLALFQNAQRIIDWLVTYRTRLSEQSISDEQRHQQQNANNAKYILRNYLAETAIRSAQAGDFNEVQQLLNLLSSPFDEQVEMKAYANVPPTWGKSLEISCSS